MLSAFHAYRRLNDGIAWAVQALAILITAFAVASVFGGAVERHVTGRGYAWMNDLPPLLLPWVVFPMAAVLLRRGGHVAVEIAPTFLRGRAAAALEIFVNLAVFAAALAFLLGGLEAMTFFTRMSATAPVGFYLPMWWIYTAFPVGFALLANFALEGLLTGLFRLAGREAAP